MKVRYNTHFTPANIGRCVYTVDEWEAKPENIRVLFLGMHIYTVLYSLWLEAGKAPR